MSLEKEGYREILQSIINRFPNTEVLNLPEVADYMRSDRKTLLGDKTFPIRKVSGKYVVSIYKLASWLA